MWSRFILTTASLVAAVVCILNYTAAGFFGAVIALLCACGSMRATYKYDCFDRGLSLLQRIGSCGAAIFPGAILVHLIFSNLGHGFTKVVQVVAFAVTLVLLIVIQAIGVYITDQEWMRRHGATV